ncbi:GTPase HflX [Candidatus Finniella inopinata]|uniref:GTPase HflX n=2 Tax=Candidatus Finniella inopinata TaxID=1696036 RepID=A0A4Q7DN64_9PROT|nr:GTPase HflX [Candidatus Finniella inopinata]
MGQPDRTQEAALEEAVGLAEAINLKVVYRQSFALNKISPATLLGKGNVENIQQIIQALAVKLVVMDGTLSPVQQRNLEQAWKCKVIDRTGLILEIFGARARTSEGGLQVELAALKHQRSRLVRSWTHLERQRGGFGFIGGPGETQLELDRRMIDQRIMKLEKELINVTKMRGLHRKARQRQSIPVIALVGYTNAGKSTLFNRLTQSNVFAENLLFATLDPTMRRCEIINPATKGKQEVIFSDTVGFISNLPTQLIAAFRATLEEVCTADLILHVRDAAHPDAKAQAQDVEKILHELNIVDRQPDDAPLIVDVYNKIDLLSAEERFVLLNQVSRRPNAVAISAQNGEGIETLLQWIYNRFQNKGAFVQTLVLKNDEGAALAWCYQQGLVLERYDDETTGQIDLKLFLTASQLDYLRKIIF